METLAGQRPQRLAMLPLLCSQIPESDKIQTTWRLFALRFSLRNEFLKARPSLGRSVRFCWGDLFHVIQISILRAGESKQETLNSVGL